MNILIDTQCMLWFGLGDPRLSATALLAIEDDNNSKWISPASYWEIGIKMSVGKYKLLVPLNEFVQTAIIDNGFRILPIEPLHAAEVVTLPHHHGDPFDRMIIAQSVVEKMSVVSSDSQFDRYGVHRIW